MRRLAFVIVIVAGIVGAGVYRGWFRFSSDNQGDKPNVTLSVDKDKIREDKDKAVEKVERLGQQAKDKVAPATQRDHD
jgi:hypothetical protein